MEFIHRPYQPGETIAAIATPPGEGGISIIRISGKEAIAIANKIFSGDVASYKTHTAHFGIVKNLEGQRIDEGLCLVMKGRRSYTGEETVELQCHGGLIASRLVLQAALQAGARAAGPGEFTFKAFMNGKLDLNQAEAVQQLIHAKSDHAYEAASHHLEGSLSAQVRSFQEELIRLAAILEAWVDFPDEGLAFCTEEQIIEDLKNVHDKLAVLRDSFHEGRKLEQGITLCLAGAPNAGKSSLMNALLDQERAIVTPIAGTTRDLIHEELTLGGLPFRLTDTAGLRETDELIEQEGIRRSRQALDSADLTLLVIDASTPLTAEEKSLLDSMPQQKTIVVWNKTDLRRETCATSHPYQVCISAKNREGLDTLKGVIDKLIWDKGAPPKDQVLITKARHHEALTNCTCALQKVISGLQTKLSPEFLAADMRTSLTELAHIIGTNIQEDVLSSIFSQFCIGK